MMMVGHFLGDVGSLLQKKQPNFDSRNFGFDKLTPLIKSIDNLNWSNGKTQKADINLFLYVLNRNLFLLKRNDVKTDFH